MQHEGYHMYEKDPRGGIHRPLLFDPKGYGDTHIAIQEVMQICHRRQI